MQNNLPQDTTNGSSLYCKSLFTEVTDLGLYVDLRGLTLSRNGVKLHVDAVKQLSPSPPSVDDDGKVQIIVVASFPGADGGRRKEDGLALVWSVTINMDPLKMDPPRTPWMLQAPYLNQI